MIEAWVKNKGASTKIMNPIKQRPIREVIPGLRFPPELIPVTSRFLSQTQLAEILKKTQSDISRDVSALKEFSHPLMGDDYLKFSETRRLSFDQAFYVFLMRLFMQCHGASATRLEFVAILNEWQIDHDTYIQPRLIEFYGMLSTALKEQGLNPNPYKLFEEKVTDYWMKNEPIPCLSTRD